MGYMLLGELHQKTNFPRSQNLAEPKIRCPKEINGFTRKFTSQNPKIYQNFKESCIEEIMGCRCFIS